MRFRLSFVALTAVAAAFTGCTGRNLLDWKKAPVVTADEKNPVVRIVALWEPSEGCGLNKLPTRGFAGQLLFFTSKSNAPVLVDGDVRVYLYDMMGTPDERAKPIHQFDFQRDAWQKHAVDGMLGPSYQLFVPYVRNHPYQAQCSLRVRLQPQRGAVAYSELIHVTLPGPIKNTDSESADGMSGQASSPQHVTRQNPAEPELGATLKSYRLDGRAPVAGTPADENRLAGQAKVEPPRAGRAAVPGATDPSTAAGESDSGTAQSGDARAVFFARLNELEAKRTGASRTHVGGVASDNAISDSERSEPPLPAGFRLTPAESTDDSGDTWADPQHRTASSDHP